MRQCVCVAAIFAACLGFVNQAQACALGSSNQSKVIGKHVRAAWHVEGDQPVTVGQGFSLVVKACPVTAELIRVDATMPAHRHGMNYSPSINKIAPGHWRVEGLLWHMPGAWELQLSLRQEGLSEVLRQAVQLQ